MSEECGEKPSLPVTWTQLTDELEESGKWQNAGVAEKIACSLFCLVQQGAAYLDHQGVKVPWEET